MVNKPTFSEEEPSDVSSPSLSRSYGLRALALLLLLAALLSATRLSSALPAAVSADLP